MAQLVISSRFCSSTCTGTWVNDSQIVTAGHCVNSRPTAIRANGVSAVSYALQTGYDGGVNGLDLAIVNFPENSSRSFRRIATTAPEVNDPIEIVGFGNNVVANNPANASGAGVLRQGTNTLLAQQDDMYITVGVPSAVDSFQGVDIELGEFATTGRGDSGGPLFFNGELVESCREVKLWTLKEKM